MGTECAAVFLLATLTSWVQGGEGQAMGPFDVIMHDVKPCEHLETTGEMVFSNGKRNKVSNTLDMDLDFKQPFDDDVSVQFHFGVWGKDGFKPDILVQDSDHACKSGKKYYPDLMQAYFDASNITDCPIPPGHYELRGVPNDYFRVKNVNTFMYGKLRVDVIYFKDGDRIGCMTMTADCVPKKSRKKGR